MGPETTSERVSEDLMQAVTCLKRVMHGMKNSNDVAENVVEEIPSDSSTVMCTLVKITGALERCIESNKTLNEVLSGKMKCTTCGATSVGLLSDCHDSATSTTTTVSHRSSEEPPRRKTSGSGGVGDDDEMEMDELCSSIGTRSIRSVSSSVNAEEDENNQTIVQPEIQQNGSKTPEEDDDEQDLVLKTILSTTSTSTSLPDHHSYKNSTSKKNVAEDDLAINDSALLDQFLQNSLLGMNPDLVRSAVETTTPEENNEEDKDQTTLLNSFFQILFANQQAQNGVTTLETGGSNENGIDSTTSSQPSPPSDGAALDSLAMFESMLAESLGNSLDATSSVDQKAAAAAARKRKSTPMKVPKSENGAGYICPMDGCNKVFKEKGSVHRHFVTHIGMRFNCDKCKASYTQKHALMLHQKIHSNPDAYQCRGCGTNYTTQNGLRLHRQRNPACMEQVSSPMIDCNASLSSLVSGALSNSLSKNNATPTKQMVSAP